jgi:hypothetical protein
MFYSPFRRRIRKAFVFIFFVYCVIYLVNSVSRNAGIFLYTRFDASARFDVHAVS